MFTDEQELELEREYDTFCRWCHVRFMVPLPRHNWMLEKADYHMNNFLAGSELLKRIEED